MIKFTILQKKTFCAWQFGKIGVLVNFILQELKFCKIAHLLLPVSLARGKFGGTRENLKHKNQT
jgi:hypothetical protein